MAIRNKGIDAFLPLGAYFAFIVAYFYSDFFAAWTSSKFKPVLKRNFEDILKIQLLIIIIFSFYRVSDAKIV